MKSASLCLLVLLPAIALANNYGQKTANVQRPVQIPGQVPAGYGGRPQANTLGNGQGGGVNGGYRPGSGGIGQNQGPIRNPSSGAGYGGGQGPIRNTNIGGAGHGQATATGPIRVVPNQARGNNGQITSGYGNQGRLDPVPRPGGNTGGYGGTNRGPAPIQSQGTGYVDRGQLTKPFPPPGNSNRKTGY